MKPPFVDKLVFNFQEYLLDSDFELKINRRMYQAVIIESSPSDRNQLIQFLAPLGLSQIAQFETFAEAQGTLEQFQDFKGLLFFSSRLEIQKFLGLLSNFRLKNPGAGIIWVTPNFTDMELRLFMQLDADQVLGLPFNSREVQEKVGTVLDFRGRTFQEEMTNPSIAKFEISIDELSEEFYRVRLIGSLSETFQFADIKPKAGQGTLVVDCDHLRVINSVGIKAWLTWMKHLKENGFTRIQFDNMRPGYLQLASFVQGFIPSNGTVTSFYLHYWNDELDLKKNFKFSIGKDFDSQKIIIPKKQEVSEDGGKVAFEVDDAASLILRFFKLPIQFV